MSLNKPLFEGRDPAISCSASKRADGTCYYHSGFKARVRSILEEKLHIHVLELHSLKIRLEEESKNSLFCTKIRA